MLGAIFGDIVGSVYEFNNTNDYNFRLLCARSGPTDDSFMTLAVAKALLETWGQDDEMIRQAVVREMQGVGRRHSDGGYGRRFIGWLYNDDPQPYYSCGNGSGMRVSACGWLYPTLAETRHAARLTAEPTHNHPEGIKGAEAIASAIFLARTGADKAAIKAYVETEFGYDLNRTLEEIRPDYGFYETCKKSCPEAIIAFLEGTDFEDVIRRAVALGGDSDTIACMAGGIAEAYFGMPEEYKKETMARLDEELTAIVESFQTKLAEQRPPESGAEERSLAEETAGQWQLAHMRDFYCVARSDGGIDARDTYGYKPVEITPDEVALEDGQAIGIYFHDHLFRFDDPATYVLREETEKGFVGGWGDVEETEIYVLEKKPELKEEEQK